MTVTLGRMAQDRVYYFVIAGFVAATAATAKRLHRDYLLLTIQGYVHLWADLAVAALAFAFCLAFVRRAWKERPENPIGLAQEVTLALFRPNTVAGVVLYLALAVFMGAFTTFKTLLPCLNDFWADPWLARLDRLVHGGQQPWRLLQPVLGYPPVTRLIETVYGPVWMSCVSLLPLFFCVSGRHDDDRRRFLVAFLLTWVLNGLLLAGVFLSGGPAFYGQLLHDDVPFGDLQRYLTSVDSSPLSASWAQHELWSMHQAGISGLGAGISDFPSLHVSMIILCCLSLRKISRRAARVLVGVAAVIVMGSVHLGWHYLVGDYAVFGIMAAIWRASGLVAARMRVPAPELRRDADPSRNVSPSSSDEAPTELGLAEA